MKHSEDYAQLLKTLCIDGDLTRLIASTYLGGSSEDYVRSIAIDSHKNIYVAGQTASSNFPITPGVFDASKNGYSDAFLVKFSGDLTNLIASTFLGGSSEDYAHSIVLDPNGISLYVTGRTLSSNFPTTPGAYNTTFHNGDAFIAKINWNFTHILASTYLRGTNNDYGTSIVLDSERNIYVSGETWSSDFPTSMDAYDTAFNGGFGDVFVSKFDRELTRLLASTYLGGADDDVGNSLAIGSDGKIYVAGYTGSSDFPTTSGSYNTSKGVFFDAFVSKLSGDLTSLIASTYLGGYYRDIARSIAIDSGGNIYVAGETRSSNFPTTPGSYDTSYNGDVSISYAYDAFVSKLDGNLSAALPTNKKQ